MRFPRLGVNHALWVVWGTVSLCLAGLLLLSAVVAGRNPIPIGMWIAVAIFALSWFLVRPEYPVGRGDAGRVKTPRPMFGVARPSPRARSWLRRLGPKWLIPSMLVRGKVKHRDD